MALFTRFGLGHLLCQLSLEKEVGIPAVQLILSLCLFDIASESIHAKQSSTVRKVLCTVNIKPGEDHVLRIVKVAPQGVPGVAKRDVMLDYLELVPKSVYGVNEIGRAHV